MYQKSVTHYIAKIAVDVMFYGGILTLFFVPWLAKFVSAIYGYRASESNWIVFAVILFAAGLCAVYIMFQLKQMFRSLLEGDPFVDANVGHFRKMAVACMLIAAIFFIKCFFMFTFGTVVVALVFVVGALFCLTLKDLFKQAINYKEENALTI